MWYKAFLKNPLWLLLLVGLLLAGGYPLTAKAGGVVTDCSKYGPGPGTLQAALAGGGTVTFTCSNTITVVPRILIDADTRIDATGQNVTLSGNNALEVFFIRAKQVDLINLTITGGGGPSGGGIVNAGGGTVTLTNCVVTGNTATSNVGAGINNNGTMTLTSTTVSSNSASLLGGGIINSGNMTLINSTVSRNNAGSGGGIYHGAGSMTLINSTVSDNTASSYGGIRNGQGQLTLIGSTVSGNSATGGSTGGIDSGFGSVTLINSTVSRNSASKSNGGINMYGGTLTIENSTISNNHADTVGGGISTCCNAVLTITNSTVSGNSTGNVDGRGGGIFNGGSATITNSTFSGNSALHGGGIYTGGVPLTLTNSTFSGNSASATQGGALYIGNGRSNPPHLINTLIANSPTGGNCVCYGDCGGTGFITDAGYNLADDNSCNLTSDTSLPNTDPILDPLLSDNDGSTQTHALLAGSPAIDRIPNGANGCGTDIIADQRGVARPQGANCDIGAYEVAVVIDDQPPVVSEVAATPNSTLVDVPVTLTATLSDTTTGNSNIASAEYNIDGGAWTAMNAADSAFDQTSESVSATLLFAQSQVGTRLVCVRGTDAFSNVSPPACTPVTVTEPPPLITYTISGTLGNNGWYKSDVTVGWTVADESTIPPQTTGCDPFTVNTDTAGITLTCTATNSGGTAEKSVTIKRDATAPTITGSAATNLNGWRNSPVMINFICNDAMSGIAACTAPLTLGEGANQTANGTATDNAGNTASTQVTGINVDLTAPAVSVTGVTNGASYTLGSVPAAGCETSDALSGVQTNATLSVTGGNADGTGTFTASCAGATDKAGNAGATASVTYQVTSVSPSAFSAFSINKLVIDLRHKTFFLLSNFTLGTNSNGIDPVKEAVTLTIANFTTTIPAGAFRKKDGVYVFAGKINKVLIEALIKKPLGSNRFVFQAAAYGADLSGTQNSVTVGLTIGNDTGTTSVKPIIIK